MSYNIKIRRIEDIKIVAKRVGNTFFVKIIIIFAKKPKKLHMI